jgi:REP element-mobilizing transposase RayT
LRKWHEGYDPAIHHRRSIRLQGHDYAGGGVYFVTLCVHRKAGNVFASEATKKVAEECWQAIPEHFPHAQPGPFVAMPDHVHGIISMVGANNLSPVQGAKMASSSLAPNRPHGTSRTLGSVIRGFKIGVVKGLGMARGQSIWHRNYYEMIVRSKEAQQKITEYICMNPWRCVQELGGGLRGIGNPTLWNGEKLGVLCSRGAPKLGRLPEAEVYFGGWHSPKEKEILDWMLQNGKRVIACPAWDIENAAFEPGVRTALEQNRMLILEMRDTGGNLAAAEARNRFIIENADDLFTPHITPGGMLDRLLNTASHKREAPIPLPRSSHPLGRPA